jgi:hypothetical protein
MRKALVAAGTGRGSDEEPLEGDHTRLVTGMWADAG